MANIYCPIAKDTCQGAECVFSKTYETFRRHEKQGYKIYNDVTECLIRNYLEQHVEKSPDEPKDKDTHLVISKVEREY